MDRTLEGQCRRAEVGAACPVRTHVDNGSRVWGRKLAFKLHDQDRERNNEFDLYESPKRKNAAPISSVDKFSLKGYSFANRCIGCLIGCERD